MIANRQNGYLLQSRIARSIAATVTLLAAGCASAASQASPSTARTADRPRLVVLLVIDQFREPYLEQYGDLFRGGLRRLLDQGRLYTNASHDHALTETAVGHAT